MKLIKSILGILLFIMTFGAGFFIFRKVKSSGGEGESTKDAVGKAFSNIKERISGSLNELTRRQKKIVELFKKHDQLEMKDLLEQIDGVTERTLRRDLLKLSDLGLINKEGTTKGVKYNWKK
jgi:predicted HTH transcriptional regulator